MKIARLFKSFTNKQDDKTTPFHSRGEVVVSEKNGGVVEFGLNVVLNSEPEGYHVGMPFNTCIIADKQDAKIYIGDNSRIHGAYVHAWKSIHIGRNVLVAAGTNIVDSNGHSTNARHTYFRRNFQDEPEGIVVQDYVWISMNCIILKGVKIGKGSIITAGSVVVNDIPEFCIAGGNPAKVIKEIDRSLMLDEQCSVEELQKESGYYEY